MRIRSCLWVLSLLVSTSIFASNIQFTSDGKFLGQVSNERHAIKIWNLHQRKVQTKISDSSGEITDYVFYPHDQRVLGLFSNDKAKVWDWATGKELITFPNSQVTLSDNGQKIAALMPDKKTIKIFDAISLEEIQVLGGDKTNVSSLAFSQDASLLATANHEGQVTIMSLENQTAVREFKVSGPVYKLQFSRDTQKLLILSEGRNITCSIWSIVTGEEVLNLRHEYLDVASFSRDGQHIVGFGPYISTYVWDLNTGHNFQRLDRSLSGYQVSLPQVTSLDGKLVSHFVGKLNISNLKGKVLSSIKTEELIDEAIISENGSMVAMETAEKLIFWKITP